MAVVACPGFPGPGSFCPGLAGDAAGALGCCLFETTVLLAAEGTAALPARAVGVFGECRELVAALPLTTAGGTYREQKKLEACKQRRG